MDIKSNPLYIDVESTKTVPEFNFVKGGRGCGKTMRELLDTKALETYESPITKFVADISDMIIKQEEDRFMAEINKSVGYNIDKEELIKALNNDREQYKFGYREGYKQGVKDIIDVYKSLGYDLPNFDVRTLMEDKNEQSSES